jgi:hypothetical protein
MAPPPPPKPREVVITQFHINKTTQEENIEIR